MKKKFLTALSLKCKDFGLTEKALDELAELGSNGLKDDATDEDINKAVDLLVPYAKAMQGEITRKTSKKPQSTKQSDDEGNGEGGGDEKTPKWFAPFKEKMEALETENTALKAKEKATERASLISEKAKKLGIPDYLIKRVSFADDADIDKELEEYKQELVSNNLVPKEQANEKGTKEEAMKAAADAWAKTLPDA